MRILCVHDEDAARMILSLALSMDPEIEPTIVESGDACLDIAREEVVDAILLDMDLGGRLDALETCRRLKADPVTSDIPVIFLAEDGPGTSLAETLETGAAACLTKPFDPLTLARTVREALGE